jgi:low affinity Fe/Cu permease
MDELFRQLAETISRVVGTFWAALLVSGLTIGTGWYFNWSENWKFNTSVVAAVVALLLLIFLQKSQSHSDKATHLKLDELIAAVEGARNEVANAEKQPEETMEQLRRPRAKSRNKL